jgi:hypothetical protein
VARSLIPLQAREDIRRLRRLLPPGYPVRVRAGKPALFAVADCGFTRGRFTITIDPDEATSVHMWRELLAHEWAHTLVWHVKGEKDHGPMWGVAYARCYCAVFRTN